MEELLKYYYNLKDIEIDNNIVFDKENNSFLIYEVKEEDIKYSLYILNSYKNNNIYKIIPTLDNKYTFKYKEKLYSLLKINGILNDNIDLKIINNKYIINEKKYDLANLWSKKIDYLEYQISELGKNHEDILNSFSFFIGLGENAISFLNINKVNLNNVRMSLEHKRAKYKEKNINYYNPFNIIIDYIIRDSSEYIKSKMLESDDLLKDIKYILNNDYNIDEIKLFYARLLFPTFYFDEVENILIDKKSSNNINKIVDIIPRYLDLLKDTYLEIKKSISIDIPNWIIKS